jgi:hypothetical protein
MKSEWLSHHHCFFYLFSYSCLVSTVNQFSSLKISAEGLAAR